MTSYAMPAATALDLLSALNGNGVRTCVAGGWAVDALLGEQTRPHSDLDLWIEATDAEALFSTLTEQGVDRLHPWPGDRPWNFVLHDGHTRRIDLHFYERLGDDRLQYGSVTGPFVFADHDVAGHGSIAGIDVTCESPEFALRCHAGYRPRDIDRRDVAALCARFDLPLPAGYQPNVDADELITTQPASSSARRFGYHSVNPYFVLTDVPAFIEFLVTVFHATEVGEREVRPDGRIDHADVLVGDSLIMVSESDAKYPARPAVSFAYVDDVDGAHARAVAAGARSILAPSDQPSGDRVAGIHDPFDNRWWIATSGDVN